MADLPSIPEEDIHMPSIASLGGDPEDDESSKGESKESLDIDGMINQTEESVAKAAKEAADAEQKLNEADRKSNEASADTAAAAAFSFCKESYEKEDNAHSEPNSPRNPHQNSPRKFKKRDDVASMQRKGKASRQEAKAAASKSRKKAKQQKRRNKLSGFHATSEKVPGGGEGEHEINGNKSRKVTVDEHVIGPAILEPDL